MALSSGSARTSVTLSPAYPLGQAPDEVLQDNTGENILDAEGGPLVVAYGAYLPADVPDPVTVSAYAGSRRTATVVPR